MAELAAGFLGPVIEIVKCVAAPIKRQFNYLCCFSNNIQNLRDEAGRLDDANKRLQLQVDRAKNNLQVIVPQVETWLINSKKMKSNTNAVLSEASNVESGCLNTRPRYSLSRRSKKLTDQMKDLGVQCMFSTISQPASPAATVAIPLGMDYEFESRKDFEEDIMETLRRSDVNMIGVCGMGGVGKTTMAKKIMNRALEEYLFEEVVMVVVSQQVDNLRIQLEIGGSLGLELIKETPQSRVHKLHTRLSGPNRILLVLDDVWKRIVLEDLGIPCGSGCKILVTSRNRDVLSAMDIPNICGLQILLDIEAQFLFREKAGIYVDSTELKSIAEKVVKECRGLPIALVTVSMALKDENNLSIWKDALRQLTQSNPSDIPNIISEVYNPLKLSYDFLDNNHAKSIFLLCCLFPEDDDIPLEHLTYFCMGLCMFEGIWELEEARGRMCALVKMLKNRFLLLDGSDEYHVRMHDVIRDVSIFITSNERSINCNSCTWISSYVQGRPGVPMSSGFPNLHLALLDNRIEPEFQINDEFIERTRELNVLFIGYGRLRSIPSLPHKTQLLKTLVMYNCESLETISDVGHLVSLEILIFHRCILVAEVPMELRGLKRLKLLEISNCWKLERVAPGVISSLVALEELKMINSFKKWEGDVEGIDRENAGLEELESLTNLRCLEIEVWDFALVAVQLRLSPKLVKFNVYFGGNIRRTPPPSKMYHKTLYLHAYSFSSWEDLSASTFVRSAECLHGYGHFSNGNMNLAINAQSIRCLTLISFNNIKNITTLVDLRSGAAVFPILEFFSLERIDSLQEMWDGPMPSNSFKNLKRLRLVSLRGLTQMWRSPCNNNALPIFSNVSSIYFRSCDGLRHVFESAKAKDCRLQLERIKILSCGVMEQVVLLQNEEYKETGLEEGSGISIFPKLKSLYIYDLPNLTSICKGIESIEFPLLTQISIRLCPNMNCLVSGNHNNLRGGIDHGHYHDLDSTHLFCQPKVSFCNLKNLTMGDISTKNAWCDKIPIGFFCGLEQLELESYSNIRSLFSSSIAENLINLQTIIISNCSKMVKVIEDKDTFDGRTISLFPRLQELYLSELIKLEYFCEWSCAIELPSLQMLHISRCPELRSFNAGSIITPALQTITADNQKFTSITDINVELQQHFTESSETPEVAA